jgi:hypothetical protein
MVLHLHVVVVAVVAQHTSSRLRVKTHFHMDGRAKQNDDVACRTGLLLQSLPQFMHSSFACIQTQVPHTHTCGFSAGGLSRHAGTPGSAAAAAAADAALSSPLLQRSPGALTLQR